jgi:hypothetical protein
MEIVVGEEEGLFNDAITFGKDVEGSSCTFYLLSCLMFGGTG